MTFSTQSTYKYILPIPITLGILILGYISHDYAVTGQQTGAGAFSLLLVIVFFFGLPYLGYKQVKTITVDKGVWTISYPYARKTIILIRNEIYKVLITENISGYRIPAHSRIDICRQYKDTITITSLETKDFRLLSALISQDFKEVLVEKDFRTGKRKV